MSVHVCTHKRHKHAHRGTKHAWQAFQQRRKNGLHVGTSMHGKRFSRHRKRLTRRHKHTYGRARVTHTRMTTPAPPASCSAPQAVSAAARRTLSASGATGRIAWRVVRDRERLQCEEPRQMLLGWPTRAPDRVLERATWAQGVAFVWSQCPGGQRRCTGGGLMPWWVLHASLCLVGEKGLREMSWELGQGQCRWKRREKEGAGRHRGAWARSGRGAEMNRICKMGRTTRAAHERCPLEGSACA